MRTEQTRVFGAEVEAMIMSLAERVCEDAARQHRDCKEFVSVEPEDLAEDEDFREAVIDEARRRVSMARHIELARKDFSAKAAVAPKGNGKGRDTDDGTGGVGDEATGDRA